MGKERLSFEDLVNGFITKPRRDHPNRKGFEFGYHNVENGLKCYKKEKGQDHCINSLHGKFYPNPPGSKGLKYRNLLDD